MPTTFIEIAIERRRWIEEALRPWCMTAPAVELRRAAEEWLDLAGRVSPDFTLWMWAWSRFPGLIIPDLWRIDEAVELRIELVDGREISGFADARRSKQDRLEMVSADGMRVTVTLDEIRLLEVLRPIEPVPDRPLTPTVID